MSVMMGIDVSHHQGNIEWAAASRHQFRYRNVYHVNQFVICKCIYESGNHRVDEQFQNNYSGAQKYGLAQGVYLYHASKSLADPEFEARRLLEVLKGRKLPYGIWHDLEDRTVQNRQKINELLAIEDDILRKGGYKTIGIYCNLSWYKNVIDVQRFQALGYPFWIARYPRNDDGQVKESLSPYQYAGAWQYSSKGKVAGIQGNVDLNIDFDGILPTEIQTIIGGNHMVLETLRNGSRGSQVKAMQAIICGKFNLELVVDGIYGSMTTNAVKQIQKQSGLTPDGVCGAQTWGALIN